MFSFRTEISIMKSVGATNGFVRIRSSVEGMLIGLISGGISVAILLVAYKYAVQARFITSCRSLTLWISTRM